MRLSSAILCSVGLLSSLVAAAPAPVADGQIPVAWQGSQERRLISLSETESKWMTEDEIFGLIRQGKKFIDITDGEWEEFGSFAAPRRIAPPDAPTHQSVVQNLTVQVSESRMRDFLTTFTGFKTRYYKSAAGRESAEWLYNQVLDIAQEANKAGKLNVSVTKFDHDWGQPSVIARVENAKLAESERPDEIVIVGAHQDSVNQWNPWFGRSPGADDDGSGSTSVIEAYRVLLENGFAPRRTVEFHWYSAEEGGLLGSQKVASAYKKEGKEIVGMLQSDMTGYSPPGKKRIVGIATDYVDADLSAFLQKLSSEYNGIPWKDVKCGYGCSDHASWTKAGYPSAFTFEAAFEDHNPYIHTSDDDVSHINFAHVAEYSRLALSFAVELSLAKKGE